MDSSSEICSSEIDGELPPRRVRDLRLLDDMLALMYVRTYVRTEL